MSYFIVDEMHEFIGMFFIVRILHFSTFISHVIVPVIMEMLADFMKLLS